MSNKRKYSINESSNCLNLNIKGAFEIDVSTWDTSSFPKKRILLPLQSSSLKFDGGQK